jgi:nitroimidazol reductase NimA-like FMN-containing flavoprotein (pyridoxamine 5'-phosphate oxidase superfamily)
MSSEQGDHGSLKRMPLDDLEKYIKQLLKEQTMCVLATCSDNVPRATPIEYRSKDMTIFFIGEPGIKLRNIMINPNVSIGIFQEFTNWNSVKGAQISGKAKVISRNNAAELEEGLAAYQWEKTAGQLGVKKFPETVELIKVKPTKIELIDMSFKVKGYSPRQTFVCAI